MCLSPVQVYTSSAFHGVQSRFVPCGKCLECKVKYQNDWMLRLSQEMKVHDHVIFFTLTYREKPYYSKRHRDVLPSRLPHLVDTATGEIYRSVCKAHVQKWFKRFRERYLKVKGYRFPGKYFITSEYGPRTLRPHYHGLVYGISLEDFEALALEDWLINFGFYKCRLVNPFNGGVNDSLKIAQYTAKYCSKGEFENPLVAQRKVYPTFHLISKGIGLSYVEQFKSYHLGLDNPNFRYAKNRKIYQGIYTFSENYIKYVTQLMNVTVSFNSKEFISYSMPRYYKNKIYGEKSLLSAQIADYLYQVSCDVYNQQLAELQAYWHCSTAEAVRLHSLQDSISQSKRYEEAKKKLGKYYDKSKI